MTSAELDARLAELLLHYKVLSKAMLDRARAFQTGRNATLAGALCDLHLVDEQTLQPLLEELTGVRAVNPTLLTVYPDFIERMGQLIPPDVVSGLLVFPVQMEVNAIHVCMLNPTDGWTTRALEALSGCRIVPAAAHEAALRAAIEGHYRAAWDGRGEFRAEEGRAVAEVAYRRLLEQPFSTYLDPAIALVNRNRDALQRDPRALEAIVRDPVIIRLVQQILCRAIEAGASDIHVEPTGEALRLRARIDGRMRVAYTLPPTAGAPVVARLKAMADLPIDPASAPLDARIGYELVWGRSIDLRFSDVPTVTGERIALRVLDRTQRRRELSDLGMDEETQQVVSEVADLPNGLILVTGPTGSGKTSTLYALLDRLNDEELSIVTAEDPVESHIPGVAQVQCGEAALRFADVLRSFLRQDPDVMMVGEVRDAETADIALKAALTGHLVLSTLHTNDAPGAVLRLLNMDLEPFIIASALRLVIAQRLIRRLCRECRRPAPVDGGHGRAAFEALSPAHRKVLQGAVLYAPGGCSACGNSGYAGRVGLFEVLRVTPAIEELIVRRATAAAIRNAACVAGMRTLREAGLRLVAAGATTLAEVLENTVADEGVPRESGARNSPST